MTKKEVSPEEIAVGRRIRELRQDVLNLDSQQAFADQLGNVTRGAVGNWERGQGIKRENLQRIADQFHASFEWLATGRGTPTAAAPPLSSIDRMLAALPPELADELHEEFERRVRSTKKLIDRNMPR